jgi:hypothetical protein
MKRVLLSMVFLATLCAGIDGQHGSAPPGYYPVGYSGDIWTGEIVSTDDVTREITLTYTNGKKSETFTGILKENYQVKMRDGSMKELKPSGIPKGSRITIFYQAKTRKLNGNKEKYYEIFEINRVK